MCSFFQKTAWNFTYMKFCMENYFFTDRFARASTRPLTANVTCTSSVACASATSPAASRPATRTCSWNISANAAVICLFKIPPGSVSGRMEKQFFLTGISRAIDLVIVNFILAIFLELALCSPDDMADFPRRMGDWLFQIMKELANRDELAPQYRKYEKRSEKKYQPGISSLKNSKKIEKNSKNSKKSSKKNSKKISKKTSKFFFIKDIKNDTS